MHDAQAWLEDDDDDDDAIGKQRAASSKDDTDALDDHSGHYTDTAGDLLCRGGRQWLCCVNKMHWPF